MELNTREFRSFTGKSGKVKVWKITVSGPDVIYSHGYQGGAFQTTSETPGSKGKYGTKSYICPDDQAVIYAERLIKKKVKEGFIEYIDDIPQTKIVDTFSFDNKLPDNMCLPKAVNTIDTKKLLKLVKDKKAIFTIKRDGECIIGHKTSTGVVYLYSRRMEDMTAKYPQLVKYIGDEFPPRSIGMFEAVSDIDTDDREYVCSINRSLPERAIRLQKENKPLRFYWFCVVYWDGVNKLTNETIESNITFIKCNIKFNWIVIPINVVEYCGDCDNEKVLEDTLQNAIKKLGIEGFVIYDGTKKYPTDAISYDGKARRPAVSWKYKLSEIDDFVVIGSETGTGDNRNKLGKIVVGKYHGNDLISYGKVGLGFSKEQRTKWVDGYLNGKVVEVKFAGLTPNKKLVSGTFLRERHDKAPDECME